MKTEHTPNDSKGRTMTEEKAPTYTSTAAEIVQYYDTHLNLTLRELSAMTGRTVEYLKHIMMQDENHRGNQ